MPIVSVSRWQMDKNEALQIARDAAHLIKQQGAQRVEFGRIHTGTDAGQVAVVVTYQDFASYGQAMEKQRNDQQFQQLLERAQKTGRLQSRNVVITEEIG